MKRLVLIDGNSIMNRAFYGIMGSKTLMTSDGTYTNAVYGFLAIMFKIIDDLNPEYMAVAFDLKGPTKRHEIYKEYKATRKGMPNELATQMPIIKDILRAMNIDIVEKEGYEGDDILGTLAKYGEKQGLDVTILSGDRDTFQLASDKITIRIPRTKVGKTEEEDYNKQKVLEEYGIEPKQLIEVKGLQGDTSDNIPGVPGIGEKTALNIIKKYKTIDKLYKAIEDEKDDLKGKQRENIITNKELAYLSRTLGEINVKVPIDDNLENLKVEEWDKEKVLEIFKKLNFNKYIERFNLKSEEDETKQEEKDTFKIIENKTTEEVSKLVKKEKKIIYFLGLEEIQEETKILKQSINAISIYNEKENEVYYITKKEKNFEKFIKDIFEDNQIEKYGYEMNYTYICLKQQNITPENMKYDVTVAAYILNPTEGKYPIDKLCLEYLNIDVNEYLKQYGVADTQKQEQLNLFNSNEENGEIEKYKQTLYAYAIGKLTQILTKKLQEINALELFNDIDMPVLEVLSDMQWNGMYIDVNELEQYGEEVSRKTENLTQEIHDLAGEEFNINSPKQLGEILFTKLKLPVYKKTKSGYSTNVEVLEKLKGEHPIIEKILEYRQVAKLSTTFVEGLKPYINPKTHRIHSFFHQTITATGRISSTDPNLQNIPTRMELGKQLRKTFKPADGKVYIDADYSQIELRVLAHISNDENMIIAFNNEEDIHKQVASKVFETPIDEVTKEQRTHAKAVNFGIVYGISDFGLAEQLGCSRKEAKQYIEQYSGIKKFMNDIIELAKKQGYVETLFNRRRYIQELQSNNYTVRQFGERVAMNTPIQGTAADIMKIAMINVYKELKKRQLDAKIVLQVHDELLVETNIENKEEVKEIIQNCMENVTTFKVPLKVEISEAKNWYEAK